MLRRLWIVVVSVLVAAATPAAATDLRVGPVTTSVSGAGAAAARRATVTVSWQNGWRTARNHDAVWLFVKTGKPQTALRHVRIAAGGHEVIALSGPPGRTVIPDDRTGMFIIPDADHRGQVEWRIQITLDHGQAGTDDVRVFALEMVYVRAGPFTLGDPDPAAIEFNAVYRSNAQGEPAGLFRVTTEGPIDVGPRQGALFYKTKLPQYEGDRLGPIPETFPKGVSAFYTMKYELTQGQYVDFLNALYSGATFFRAIHGGRDYSTSRGTIQLEGRDYVARVPARPANWISWDDGLAFADWAGLRPMTELEFTKAARGPGDPVAHEFPWGTGSAARLRRVMGTDDDLVTGGEADEARLADETRDLLGASFYGVMDLAGSVWERVVTFGHPRGRAFRGTHGDGRITEYGQATNGDWPIGDAETGGYGYRGGGYYERGMTIGPFNPYSPIAYRRYGSWGGGPRSIAYGFRAVRTAPAPAALEQAMATVPSAGR